MNLLRCCFCSHYINDDGSCVCDQQGPRFVNCATQGCTGIVEYEFGSHCDLCLERMNARGEESCGMCLRPTLTGTGGLCRRCA